MFRAKSAKPGSGGLSLGDVWRVFTALHDLTSKGGKGVEGRKEGVITSALVKCSTGDEVRFLVRMLCCNCRTGATVVTFVDAVADAVTEIEVEGMGGWGEAGGEGGGGGEGRRRKARRRVRRRVRRRTMRRTSSPPG